MPSTRPWIVLLARFGLAAHGIVYFLVGLLAARRLFLGRGGPADKQSALLFLERQPLGELLLVAMAIGLLGYVGWRLIQVIWDPEAIGPLRRVGSAFIAAAYGGLAWFAFARVVGEPVRRGGDVRLGREASADVLGWPGGKLWLTAIAIGILGLALYDVVRALREEFLRPMRTERMTARELAWARRLGKLGMIARALVFATFATLVIAAARAGNPQHVKGLGGTLQALATGTGGPWLLAFTALGLVAYGAYVTLIESRYRRIAAP